MRKKVLALALALVMVIAMLPTVAFAAAAEPKWAPIQSVKVGDSELTCTSGTGTGDTLYEVSANVSAFSDTKLTVTATEGTTLSYYVSPEVKANIFTKKSEQLDGKASEFKSLTSGTETKVEGLSANSNYIYIKAVLSGETKYAAILLTETGYTSASDLATALGVTAYSSGDIKLTADVTLKAPITVATTATIDLNGKTITGNFANSAAIIVKGEETTLTITDSTEESKGTVTNSSSTAIEVTAAKLEVKNGVTISGASNVIKASHTGSSTNVKGAEVTIDGAIVKATDKNENALSGTGNVKLTIKGAATEITGQWSSTWGEDSSIEAGYFTFFQLNSKKAAEGPNVSILGSGCGFLPVEEGKDFTYKVGEADSTNAEGYVKLDAQGDNKLYGDISMLVQFYGKLGKTIYVQKNATLTLAEFGNVVGGKFDNSNTLTFADGEEVETDVTLTISGTMKVGLIKYSGTHLKVNRDGITAAKGYAHDAEGNGEIKYDVDKNSSNAVAEVTVDGKTYTYTADSLSAMFRDIQGKEATVKLLKDVSYGQQIKLGGDTKLTLDLNGHTYTYTGETAAFNVTGKETSNPAELTVKDSSGNKTGVLDCSKTDEAICVGDFTKKEITQAANKVIIDAGVTVKGSITVIDKGTLEVSGAIEAKGFAISGNGSRDGTTITIHNGASLKSENTTAIYHPQEGTLTIGDAEPAEGAAAPEITGVAGVVVRDGTVTVNDADITATGTGDIKVGDAETTVPAGGIVLDSVTGYGTGDEKVTVKDATVTVEEGQPTVTYTEAGETPDYSTESEKPTDHIDVTAGTYQSGEGKADPSMAPFINDTVKESSGLASDGEIKAISEVQKEKPFLVDFGYIADKTDLESSASSWRSPNGITYNASDWKDATFYWAFNRALKDKETVTVKFAISADNSYTDTCIGSTDNTSPRYASSFLNATQNTDSAVVEVGDWTISSPDGTFTVSEEFQTAEVTLPKTVTDSMPVVTPATLSADAETTEGSVKAQITKADNDKKEYTVAVEANNLHEHENGEGNMGYWVGFAVEVPKDQEYKGFYYQFEGEEAWKYSGLEDIATNTKGVAFYFADTKNTDVKLVWTTEEAKGSDPTQGIITFHVDFTGVKHYVPTPVNPPVSGGTVTPSATVTTPAATNGSYTVSDKNAKAGDTVTITPKADEGYTVDTVVVTDKDGKDVTVTDNGDGTYSFVMPEKASQPVTVKVTFAKLAPSAKFVDVPQTAWYAEYVDYVVANGLMEGTSDTIFSPNMTTNRAMLVTILYRLEGKPAVTKDIPFSDVAAGEWYSDAINWAAANEIVNGYGDDTFRPLRELSREEAAAILYRYAEYKEYDVTATDDLADYTDAETVSTWADTAMSWAVAEGIIKGTSETKLTPDGTAVRAQAAAMLTRFCENVAK